MVMRKAPVHAAKKAPVKEEVKDSCAKTHDDIHVNYIVTHNCQKRNDVLARITSLHDELDKKIDALYDRLAAATTISNELKSIMMLELENLIRAKNRVNGVRSAVLSRMCAEVLDKEDAESIGKIFMDFATAATPQKQ